MCRHVPQNHVTGGKRGRGGKGEGGGVDVEGTCWGTRAEVGGCKGNRVGNMEGGGALRGSRLACIASREKEQKKGG